jgi:hypothetical protein
MRNIKNILIVGGGSAGWMSAAYLSKCVPNVNITLVESPKVGTIGVGESTLGHINKFLDSLELKDEEWMKFCNATYKTSIKFTDFRRKGTHFQYPFGDYDLEATSNNLQDWCYYEAYFNNNEIESTSFANINMPHILMTEHNKLSNTDLFNSFNFHFHTAYHMDAEKFGQYLREHIAVPHGVKHIQATINNVVTNDAGISAIETEEGITLSGYDLYIDCTGFKKLLIQETLGVPFEPFDDVLMNDRALAVRIPYVDRENEMESVTNCTAIENGWVWNIPLWNRIGTGYVHSSKFADWEQAEEEFRNHLSKREGFDASDLTFNRIHIKHGIQKEPWFKNVCSIGLALGFIEPLESTGLLTTHENIIRLGETLSRRQGKVTQFDVDGWNLAAKMEIENFKQFVSIHYGLSERDDTPYWKHVTSNVHYKKNHLNMEPELTYSVYDLMNTMNKTYEFDATIADGKTCIATGMGLNPVSTQLAKREAYRFPGAVDMWENVRKKQEDRNNMLMQEIEKMPTHYEFLRDNIYGEE